MREMGNEEGVMGEGRMNQQTVCKSFVLFGEEFPLPKNTTAGRPPSIPFLPVLPLAKWLVFRAQLASCKRREVCWHTTQQQVSLNPWRSHAVMGSTTATD